MILSYFKQTWHLDVGGDVRNRFLRDPSQKLPMVTKLTETNFFFHRNESFRSLPQLLWFLDTFPLKLLRAEIFGLFSASIGALITYGYPKCVSRLPEQD